MPFVNVKVIEGVISSDQKKELLAKVTDAVAAVYGETMRELVTVVVEEVKSGDWAIAGKPITTAEIRARIEGAPEKPKARRRG
jgi:4-oxalocrotonate tautomerase